MGTLTTIYWRDIPASVQCRTGRNRHSVALTDRFQQAIDRAAMRAGAIGTDEYLEEWRRESRDCGNALEDEAAAEAARLEAAYPPERLAGLVESLGRDGGP